MTSFAPPRVAAGVPDGGQFTTFERPEADVLLHDGSGPLSEPGFVSYEEALSIQDQAARSANYWDQRFGASRRTLTEVEDIAQDSVLALLESQRNGVVVSNTGSYLVGAAKSMAARSLNTAVRHEDLRAYRMYKSQTAALAAELGRPLTSAEQDAVAENIRGDWPNPNNRPSQDFRRAAASHNISIQAPLGGGRGETVGTVVEEVLADREAVSNYVEPGSALDAALDAVEGHEGDRRDARRLLWDALAPSVGAPSVARQSLSVRRCTQLRAEMSTYPGGVAGAVETWNHGVEDAGTAVLFAPFGDIDADQKDRVAELMTTSSERAEVMWSSALMLANRRKTDQLGTPA